MTKDKKISKSLTLYFNGSTSSSLVLLSRFPVVPFVKIRDDLLDRALYANFIYQDQFPVYKLYKTLYKYLYFNIT